MNRAGSGDVENMELEMREVGTAAGERARGAPSATRAAAVRAGKTGRPGAAAASVLDAADRPARSASRQIRGKPMMALLVGFALGYGASLWASHRR